MLYNLRNQFQNNPSSIIAIESIILELLSLHLKSLDKQFLVDSNVSKSIVHLPFDIYVPEGFDNFTGPTGIEIKIFSNKNSFRIIGKNMSKRLSDKFHQRFLEVNSISQITNLLIIIFQELSSYDKEKIKDSFDSEYRNKFNIEIWGIQELEELLEKYPVYAKVIEENPSKPLIDLMFDKNFNSPKTETNQQQQEYLDRLKDSYKNEDLVLFLGAGVSLDAKIPTWDELINNLTVSLIDSILNTEDYDGNIKLSPIENKLLVEQINYANGNSPIQLVRFIKNGIGENFKEKLIDILYNKCINSSKLLDSITNLCIPSRTTVGVQGIVTYNFDDLIEKNLESKNISYLSIFKDATIPSKEELGIYHVHGFLPSDLNKYEDIENDNLLVFSEEEYHKLLLDSYHWANLVQLNYFREKTCLFIGISLTDPNVRRLLEIAKSKQQESNNCKHYIILKKASFEEIKKQENVNENNIDKFLLVYHQLKETELKGLGLNVIWVEDYPDIPSLLDSIRK